MTEPDLTIIACRRDPATPSRDYKPSVKGEVFWCRICAAPVVDSTIGQEGHKLRLGHWPERR